MIFALFGSRAGAEGTFKVYDVEVYVFDPPTCGDKGGSVEVEARVGYFSETFSLAEGIAELARLASQALSGEGKSEDGGVKALHSIRIVEAVPFQQAELAGVAVRCEESAVVATTDPKNAVLTAQSATVFSLSLKDPLGPVRTVEMSNLIQLHTISGSQLERLKRAILSVGSDAEHGLSKPQPFVPSIGFRFQADEEVWWLVSLPAETGVLVHRTEDWRRVRALNLDPDDLAVFRELTSKGG